MKIIRVYGSKKEGWNCSFGWTDLDWTIDNVKGVLPLGIPYTENNPIGALYDAMTQYLIDKGFNPVRDDVQYLVQKPVQNVQDIEQITPEVEAPKPKKTRKKKGD